MALGLDIFKKWFLLLILVLGLGLTGCQAVQQDGFAIYLLEEPVPTSPLAQIDIEQLILHNQPLLSTDDIVAYDFSSHTLEVTRRAYHRIQRIFPMPVKVDGIPFVVCVGSERIYTGAFWTPASSLSYDGVIIMQPLDATSRTIHISLGYPSQAVFTGEDPEGDPRILDALEHDEKLN